MARFSGKQFKGAARVARELRREEAEARQRAHDKRMAALMAKLEIADVEVDADIAALPAPRKRKRTKKVVTEE